MKDTTTVKDEAAAADTKDVGEPANDMERELEQKMVKIVSKMPEKTQNRFKVLHVLSDKRSKINDEFENEMKLLSE